jgi:20S proteasome subunit alpha 6
MQKSLYDNSCDTWHPQGRIFQVEYAMEAVNQGNCLIGLRNDKYVVLCGLKTTANEKLAYYQEKLYRVSNHMGIGISGLTPDGSIN